MINDDDLRVRSEALRQAVDLNKVRLQTTDSSPEAENVVADAKAFEAFLRG